MGTPSQNLPLRIETERLILRPYAAGDGTWFYAMSQHNRDHLRQFESDNVVMRLNNEDEAEALARDLAVDWSVGRHYFIGAFDKRGGEFVAQVYIGVVDNALPEYEIGYFADVDHQGQGFVSEAVRAAIRFSFEHLGAYRLRLECDDTNLGSIRVAERCGFQREGHIRQNKRHPDGAISGTLHFGLLRSEYESSGDGL
ncbi:MAG: GNAT family N-acetyltransferase [Anaerolineales bacterium]|nr:GNAT family N-acetyltransferase [Anaerolineales bacterium]